MSFKYILIILFFSVNLIFSQNLYGINGLIKTPSADLMEDGTYIVGITYLPKSILNYENNKFNGYSPFISFSFLPFIEFSIRITRLIKNNIETLGIGDRTPSCRVQLIKESAIIPSFSIGFQDFMTAFGGESAIHNHASYIVASKKNEFSSNKLIFDYSFGYSFKILQASYYEMLGIFGGLKISKYFNDEKTSVALIAEYDSRYFNFGSSINLNKKIQILISVIDLKHFTSSVSFSTSL